MDILSKLQVCIGLPACRGWFQSIALSLLIGSKNMLLVSDPVKGKLL